MIKEHDGVFAVTMHDLPHTFDKQEDNPERKTNTEQSASCHLRCDSPPTDKPKNTKQNKQKKACVTSLFLFHISIWNHSVTVQKQEQNIHNLEKKKNKKQHQKYQSVFKNENVLHILMVSSRAYCTSTIFSGLFQHPDLNPCTFNLQTWPEHCGVTHHCGPPGWAVKYLKGANQKPPGGVDACFLSCSPFTLDPLTSSSRISASSLKGLSLYSIRNHFLNYRTRRQEFQKIWRRNFTFIFSHISYITAIQYVSVSSSVSPLWLCTTYLICLSGLKLLQLALEAKVGPGTGPDHFDRR